MEFLKDLNTNDGSSPAVAHIEPIREQLNGLFDTSSDALDGDPKSKNARTRPPRPITYPISILDKIGGHIKSSAVAAPTPPPTAAPHQHSFLDKYGDALHQVAVHPAPSTPPSNPHGLLEKLDCALGGLVGGEQTQEDIDLFQGRIVEESPQDCGSEFEQTKDKQSS